MRTDDVRPPRVRPAAAQGAREGQAEGFRRTGVARIVDKDPKTVSRWLRHQTEPRWEAREMLLALGVVLERLAQVMERGAAEDWLFTPVPLLDYQRPVDLLRRGEHRPVLGLVDAIGEGVFT